MASADVSSLFAKLFVVLVLASLLLSTPSSAQWPSVEDASYVVYSDPWSGDQEIDLWVQYSYWYWWDYLHLDSVYLPGAVTPAHYDCDCNYIDYESSQAGYWYFYPYGVQVDNNLWYFDLFWDFYAPVSDSTACSGSGCLACDNPVDETTWYEYYDTYWGWLWVWTN